MRAKRYRFVYLDGRVEFKGVRLDERGRPPPYWRMLEPEPTTPMIPTSPELRVMPRHRERAFERRDVSFNGHVESAYYEHGNITTTVEVDNCVDGGRVPRSIHRSRAATENHFRRKGFTGPVRLTNAGGALPAGLDANTDYWVKS